MYRVLITDDEKIEREGIKFLLSMEEGEYEIQEASNGKQALNILRSQQIDFLLTDIKMPHMDGLELAEKLEYWFMAYKENWRSTGKEGDLHHIAEIVFWYADWLRHK